ncbi:MAG: hypothetical protein OIN66_02395 [Candidatus Methanoperedens sp.]|nr:hypothetical protein [Candidatus Methanoperedens sp.]
MPTNDALLISKSGLVKLATILTGNRQKLMALKSRIITPEQRQKYAALAKVQLALEKSTKSQAEKYKVLTGAIGKLKNMFAAIAKGAAATARSVWETAKKPVSWLMSKLKKKPAGLSNIEAIDDLGVAPIVIGAAVVATIAALSAAIGYLISRASALEEQIDALNDDIDYYEQQQRTTPNRGYGDRYYEVPEDEYNYEEEWW